MPRNASYMFIAYGAAAVVLGCYVVSLVTRVRAMSRRGAAIEPVTRP